MEKLNKDQLTDLFNKGTNELNNGNPLKAIEFFKKMLKHMSKFRFFSNVFCLKLLLVESIEGEPG